MSVFRTLVDTRAPAAVILVRLMVGVVFLTEGLLKFMQPDALGAGRFVKIGIPAPEIMGPFVGVCEIVCGGLVLAGLLTRLGSLVLWINISVAILSTKIPILLGHGFWMFQTPPLAHYGFWSMMHESRTDLCMWLGTLFLIIGGAGRWSVDALLARRKAKG
ncbi:MAG: DoxX family protein [Planctomycetota bacterium]|nr:DoxX family protein [Planctomycetota bacterium]